MTTAAGVISKSFSVERLKRNEHEVSDYNKAVRQSKSSYGRSKHHGKPFKADVDTSLYSSSTSALNTARQLLDAKANSLESNQINVYKAADGTVYKHYDAGTHFVEEIDYPTKNVIHIPNKYHERYRQSLNVTEVPQNIKHKFGTAQTARLLDDQVRVHSALSKIYNSGIIKKYDKTDERVLATQRVDGDAQRTAAAALAKAGVTIVERPTTSARRHRKEKEENTSIDTTAGGTDYYDLGNHLRHVIAHGYPQRAGKSWSKWVHNADLSKEFLSDVKNVDSPYRRHKDWLGNWLFRFVSIWTSAFVLWFG